MPASTKVVNPSESPAKKVADSEKPQKGIIKKHDIIKEKKTPQLPKAPQE